MENNQERNREKYEYFTTKWKKVRRNMKKSEKSQNFYNPATVQQKNNKINIPEEINNKIRLQSRKKYHLKNRFCSYHFQSIQKYKKIGKLKKKIRTKNTIKIALYDNSRYAHNLTK